MTWQLRDAVVKRVVLYGGLALAAWLVLLLLGRWMAATDAENARLDTQTVAALDVGKAWRSRLAASRAKAAADSVALARLARARAALADSALAAHRTADSLGRSLAAARTASDSLAVLLARVALDSGAVTQLQRALDAEKASTARLAGMVAERDRLLADADVAFDHVMVALREEQAHRKSGCLLGWCPSRLTVAVVALSVGYVAGRAGP